jgi:hypothetical protein
MQRVAYNLLVSFEGGEGRLIENIGSVLSCIGAIFNCKPGKKEKRIGFGVWILSNSCLWVWCFQIQAWFPLAMYTLFVGTSSYGFYHHLEEKK